MYNKRVKEIRKESNLFEKEKKMKLIYGSDGTGKTRKILELSSESRIPILCESQNRKQRLLEKAKGYDLSIPMPIVYNECKSDIEVLVDDPKRLLECMFNVKLKGITVNVNDEDVVKL